MRRYKIIYRLSMIKELKSAYAIEGLHVMGKSASSGRESSIPFQKNK